MKYAIFENLDKAKSILRTKEISLEDPTFIEIRNKLQKNNKLGYIGWVISLIYEKGQSKESVYDIIDTIIQPAFRETSSWFTKDVLEIESAEEFTDQLNKGRNRKLSKKMWLKFPSEQKKLMNWEDPNDSTLLVNLWDARYENLISKISRYTNRNSLLIEIRTILSSSNKEGFDWYIERCKYNHIEIIYSSRENEVIIARVKN
ncbi:hypothetical protein EBU94_03435, partial [bacterium]|nr:hypothetical protein [bacterium]